MAANRVSPKVGKIDVKRESFAQMAQGVKTPTDVREVNRDLQSNPFTLSRWILTEMQTNVKDKSDLTILLNAIATGCKVISNAAKKAGIYNLYGLAGNQNASGDAVKKLDVYGNDVMINCIDSCGKVMYMASEENDEAILVKTAENKYLCVFDPVDGSSNIDANVSVGTIFGIYQATDPDAPDSADLLQKGTELVCAGYCMYGGATILMLTFGQEVNGFTLDPSLGEFLLTHENVKIPEKGKIYSVNEGNSQKWDEVVTKYVHDCKFGLKPKKARYIGSMVADVHRTLLYGGIFMYPGDSKNPNGKLRLVYELNPMSFLCEVAGGLATTGRERVRDIQPQKIHERRPIFLGSKEDVEKIQKLYKELDEKKNEK